MLSVRRASTADAPVVARIYVESWNEGFAGMVPSRALTEELVTRWEQDLAAPLPHRWWVAAIDGAVVGFAGIAPGELDTIAVDPAYWRAGVGRSLMTVALDALRDGGCHEPILWTWADYPLGESFYVATGWHPTGRTRDEGTQIQLRHAR